MEGNRRWVGRTLAGTLGQARSAQAAFEELFYQREAFGIVELRAAVEPAGDGLELHGALRFLIRRLQCAGLREGRLRVLVAVDQEQRGSVGIDVKDRAGEARKFGHGVGLAAEEELQRGDADGEAVRVIVLARGTAYGRDVVDGAACVTEPAAGEGNRPINDPVAAIGLERSCAPAWHIAVSGLSTRRGAS